jgi:uncharacterized protein
MVLCDVNVILGAGMAESPHHRICRDLVEELLDGGRSFACSELVLAAVVRIATNPRVWKKPATVERAFEFVEAIREHPNAVNVLPGPRHFRLFRDLVISTGSHGPDTTDAYLAALAIEHGCEWWTADGGFARFPKLRLRNVLAA